MPQNTSNQPPHRKSTDVPPIHPRVGRSEVDPTPPPKSVGASVPKAVKPAVPPVAPPPAVAPPPVAPPAPPAPPVAPPPPAVPPVASVSPPAPRRVASPPVDVPKTSPVREERKAVPGRSAKPTQPMGSSKKLEGKISNAAAESDEEFVDVSFAQHVGQVIRLWWEGIRAKFNLKETPSWLASMIVHLAIILMLALIPIATEIGDSLTIFSGPASETEGTDDITMFEVSASDDSSELMTDISNAIDTDALKLDLAIPETPANLASNSLSMDAPILGGLKGRSGALKEVLLKAYGGTAGTEDAVAAGLAWLAKQQKSDGTWSLVGPYPGGASGENKPAATAMALLAFLGAGNTHLSGEYQANVKKGLDYILRIQDEDGFFAKLAAGTQRTYAQAQCSIAICELYGMTGDPKLEPIAMRAIKYAKFSQGGNGGWRYQPKEPGDMSVTGWYVMALMSARMGGLLVDSDMLENVNKFLDLVQRADRGIEPNPTGERYAYQPYSAGSPPMTAEGMLCRLYLGWSATDERIQKGCELLCNNPISRNPDRRSFYYWYYATTTLHHVGGDYWNRWNDVMKVELPALQEKSGPQKGSWAATADPHEGGGGRLYATCFSLYCLESYYRHLPLNRMKLE